jgi:hypothetical protein
MVDVYRRSLLRRTLLDHHQVEAILKSVVAYSFNDDHMNVPFPLVAETCMKLTVSYGMKFVW